MTPMMEQYFEIKEQYKDFLLFYRLGDFYEMFFDDAITASRVLELTLTGRDCGEAERAPMCGVPFHAADTYIGRLIEKARHNLFVNRSAVNANNLYSVWVNHLANVASQALKQEQHTRTFHTAAGASCAGTRQHQNGQNTF